MLDSMSGVWVHERLKVREWHGEAATVVQPKRDGWSLTCLQQDDPALGLCVFGRKLEAHLERSHQLDGSNGRRACDWYRTLADRSTFPPHSSIVGELWVPGKPASAVVTAMRDAPEELRFMPFAVPWWAGQDLSQEDVERGNAHICRAGLEPAPTVQYRGEGVKDLMACARHWDAEGVVLKLHNFGGWYKVKEVHTVDLVVTKLVPGDPHGRHSDAPCGSLEGSVLTDVGGGVVRLAPVADVSGMSDEVRAAITPADVGRVMEIRYQYVASGGRLRHPRFIRWRDDKPARECDESQLET